MIYRMVRRDKVGRAIIEHNLDCVDDDGALAVAEAMRAANGQVEVWRDGEQIATVGRTTES